MKEKNRINSNLLLMMSGIPVPRRSKYRAVRVSNGDGTVSDSKKEARLDAVFMGMQTQKNVLRVVRKERFPMVINNLKICTYEADWTVYFKEGHKEVYDAKGFKTPVYKIKKKLMKALFNIDIQEV